MGSNNFSYSEISAQFPISATDTPKIATASKTISYSSLTKYQDVINKQAIYITTIEGDTTFKQLHLIIKYANYISVFTVNSGLPVPENPGITPAYGPSTTVPQISKNNRIYAIQVNTYNLYHKNNTRLKNIIMAALTDTYINPLCNPIKKYSQVNSLMIITHLWTTYGIITSK